MPFQSFLERKPMLFLPSMLFVELPMIVLTKTHQKLEKLQALENLKMELDLFNMGAEAKCSIMAGFTHGF